MILRISELEVVDLRRVESMKFEHYNKEDCEICGVLFLYMDSGNIISKKNATTDEFKVIEDTLIAMKEVRSGKSE